MAINYDPTALTQVKTYDAQLNLFTKSYPHFMETIELAYYTSKDPQAGIIYNTSLPNLNFVHHLLSKITHNGGTAITNWKLTGADLTTLQAAFYPNAEFCIVTDTTNATTKNTSQKEALKGTILSTLQTLYTQPYVDGNGAAQTKALLQTLATDEKFKQESKAFIAITQTNQVDGMDIDKAYDFCMINKTNFSGLETSQTSLTILCQYLLKGSPQNQMLFDTSFLKLKAVSATEEYEFVPGTFDFVYDGACETCICS